MPTKGAAKTRAYDRVSAKRLMADVEALTRWVRLSGTPGELQALRYAQRQLKAAGCATALLMHDAYISLPGSASLTAIARRRAPEPFSCVTHSFSAPTAPNGLEGVAVFAGNGTPTELAAAGVGGKIVVVDGLATPDRAHAAGGAGAVGLVCLNRDPFVHEMIVSPVWGSPTLADVGKLPRMPVVSVASADGDRLRDLAASGYVRLVIATEVDTGWRRIPILTADLAGEVEDTFVMLAGHVDSWHRGAMDNGTANATMLEVARVLAGAKRYRGVRFAFWSGHSHGRYAGSTWYADHYWHELNERCVVHVYVDSVGGRNAVINRRAYSMPETRAVADRVIRELTGESFEGGPVGRGGDQSFLGVGLPSLLMSLSEQPTDSPDASRDFSLRTGGATGGLGWWWHTTEDLPDKITSGLLLRDAKIYAGVIETFATEPILPLEYGATSQFWMEELSSLPTEIGRHVDIAPVLADARRLIEATTALDRTVRPLRAKPSRKMARTINSALMALGRALIPASHTGEGRFGHDPALDRRGIPLLAAALALGGASGGDVKHLAVRAQRDLNAIRYALHRAAGIAEDVVAEIKRARRRRAGDR